MSNSPKSSSETLNPSQSRRNYEFGGFQLDPIQCVLRRMDNGQPVHLTGRAFDALCYLVQRHGELIDKATLIRTLWPSVIVEENNLTQTIYALRQTLGEKPGENRFIVTVPGRGYRFVAAVREGVPETVSGASGSHLEAAAAPATAVSADAAARTNDRLFRRVAVALLSLALVGGGWWGLNRMSTANRAVSTSTAIVSAAARTSVAVLPFTNMTGDASMDYLGDGMAEELINTLTNVPGLKVPARTSSFAYRGRNTDIRQIAQELGVGTILEGSVRAAGKRVRITAQLINAQDGLHLWSETFDEEFTDIFKLQDKLASTIQQALQPKLAGGTPVVAAKPPQTYDVEAYQLTMQGFALLERGDVEKSTFTALGFFQRAIARDPQYARAYAGIATAHLIAMRAQSPDSHLAAAEQAARRALQLDPTSAKAESVLGQLAFQRYDMVSAEQHHRRAQILDPGDAMIRYDHALVQAYVGHMRVAVQQMREAYALAPAIPQVVRFTGTVYSWAGLDAEALRYAKLAVALGVPEDDYFIGDIRGQAALRAGRYADYLRDSFPPFPADEPKVDFSRARELSMLVFAAVADPNKRAAALAARARLYPRGGTLTAAAANRCAYNGSKALVMLGDLDAAYDLANQCKDEAPAGEIAGENCPWQPEWRAFRRDPRFQAYVARRGAIPYYEKYGPPDECDFTDGKLTCH